MDAVALQMLIPTHIRFAANLSILFPELPLAERPSAAAEAGFTRVESWWPFAGPTPSDHEIDEFTSSLEDSGVRLIALNCYAGDMASGDRGLVSHPSRIAEFRASIPTLLTVAERTGCELFNALYGQREASVSPEEQDEVALENLALCARSVATIGGKVLIEALARGENGAYPITTAEEAMSVVRRSRDRSGADNIQVLLDTYHLASNGDDAQTALVRYADYVGHVQVADAPGRHEPGTGGFDFGRFFDLLEKVEYGGWVGLEYRPLISAETSFEWLPWERRGRADLDRAEGR